LHAIYFMFYVLSFKFYRSCNRGSIAPKDTSLFKDAEFAITWKSKVTRVQCE